MIGLLQRVSQSSVTVDSQAIGQIAEGVLVLVGVQREDNEQKAKRLLERILTYRIFSDDEGKMNRSVTDINGGLLLVPQFTLAADTKKGTRPGFSTAAAPGDAQRLFEFLVDQAYHQYGNVACGKFGADMQVSLINNGPVTFWLET